MFERMGDAWSVLRGLKRAVQDPRSGTSSQRIGSPPDTGYDDPRAQLASLEFYRHYTQMEPDRISIYSDMDEMFQYSLIHSAMEIYIEDATIPDSRTNKTVWVSCEDPNVQSELSRLFDRMQLEDRLTADMWGMAKYGDHFTALRYDNKVGVYDAIPLEPRICHRHETSMRVLQGFSVGETSEVENRDKNFIPPFKPWDMAHFRVRGKRVVDPYGTPFFLSSRLIYKVLKLMEEQMVVYRMNMHADRLLFKVFTGAAGHDERMRAVRMWRREVEKSISIDHSTGRMTGQYAPFLFNNNIYWPVGANDDKSGVEKLPGSSNAGDIMDVAYMRDLLFATIRVPKGFMGFDDTQGYRGTDTLSSQSIRFARGVRRMQRHYLQGLTRICRIHLALRSIDSREPKSSFTLEMSPTSFLDEAHRAQLYQTRCQAMDQMLEIGAKMQSLLPSVNIQAWAQYVLREFGGFNDGEISMLMAPSAQTPDLTYVPSPMTFRPPGGPLSVQQAEAIKEAVEGNEDLKEAIRKLVLAAPYSTPSSYSSQYDRDDLWEKGETPAGNKDLLAEATDKSKESRDKASKEAEKKVSAFQDKMSQISQKVNARGKKK